MGSVKLMYYIIGVYITVINLVMMFGHLDIANVRQLPCNGNCYLRTCMCDHS